MKVTVIRVLLKILRLRDKVTYEHTKRSVKLISKLAYNLNDHTRENLFLLVLMHDIGKICIEESVLQKAGSLTKEEYSAIKKHPEIGYYILKDIPGFKNVSELVLKHHEWWNGEGYPLGLKADEIPLECRIFSIVDAYDAMTNYRPYKNSNSHQEAKQELQRNSGTQFDPYWVERFLKLTF